MEFHVSRKARQKYQFEDSLFSFDGNVIFANFYAARLFAQHMNEQRDLVSYPEQAVHASHLNAMGLIDEIMHYIIFLYRVQKAPRLYYDLETSLQKTIGKRKLNSLIHVFLEEFPPTSVYQGKISLKEYLEGETNGIPNRFSVLEEVLMLWLTNQNPACKP